MNKAILMGRLVRDPELRMTSSNISVSTFTLAVDRRFKTQSGERQADFISVVAWRQQAEFASRYFKQGSRMLVVGSIQTRNWEDQNGQKRYATEVVAEEIYFADSKRQDSASNAYGQQSNATYSSPFSPSEAQESFSKPTFVEPKGDFFEDSDDDISLPFEI